MLGLRTGNGGFLHWVSGFLRFLWGGFAGLLGMRGKTTQYLLPDEGNARRPTNSGGRHLASTS